MITFGVLAKDVFKDFPEVREKWMELINLHLDKELKENEITFFYTCVFKDNLEQILLSNLMRDKDEELILSEGDFFIDLTLKYEKFIMSDRMNKFSISPLMKQNITDSLKARATSIKALENFLGDKNSDIFNSNNFSSTGLFNIEYMKDYDFFNDVESKDNLSNMDIDDILDKISKEGIESLTTLELKALDDASKDRGKKK
jgi:hypothetical protein